MSLAVILKRVTGVVRDGEGYRALCPVHDDHDPSLGINVGDNGSVVLKCRSRACPNDTVLATLRLTFSDLYPDVEAVFDYRDQAGTLVYQAQKRRLPDGGKRFVMRHWVEDRVVEHIRDLRRVPYRLDELVGMERILYCEGEKDTDAAWAAQFVATTNAFGADGFNEERHGYLRQLSEAGVKTVTLVPHHDEPGLRLMRTVGDAALQLGLDVRWLDLYADDSAAAPKADLYDFLQTHSSEELHERVESAPAYVPSTRAVEHQPPAVDDVPGDGTDDDEEDEHDHLTDVGNGRRFAREYGHRVRYVGGSAWYFYDTRRWALDELGHVTILAKQIARKMHLEAVDADPRDANRAQLLRHAMRAESARGIWAMLEMAKTEDPVAVRPDVFDIDPWVLNVLNGTVDLRTGERRPHRLEDMISKAAPVTHDPAATCPLWIKFLDRIFEGDDELIAYMQRVLGYALTGSTQEQKMFILHGRGQNGKTTLIETVRDILGMKQYAESLPAGSLIAKSQDAIPNDLAKLPGTRFVSAVETAENRPLAEPLVKALTGGDTIDARFLHREWFSFRPTFKIFLATNHLPTVEGSDDGIWRRLHYVPFKVYIPDHEKDPELPQKLLREASGILNWLLAGCLAWQRHGLRPPVVVLNATKEYRLSQDVLGRFLDEACVEGSTGQVAPSKLHEAYVEWCKQVGDSAVDTKKFSKAMRERGFFQDKGTKGARRWLGVMLTPDWALAG